MTAASAAPAAVRAGRPGVARRCASAVAAAMAVAAWILAWRLRFVQDDAFISFLYARNLVEGHGLAWFGARVEGYTNLLWVLWMALGLRVGAEPVAWSWAGGLAAFAFALHAVWRLGLLLLRDAALALVVLFTFASHYSVLAFATGGLETMMQTALLAQAALQLVHLVSPSVVAAAPVRGVAWRYAGLSLLVSGAVLAHPDSLLAVATLGIAALRLLALQRSAADGGAASWRVRLALGPREPSCWADGWRGRSRTTAPCCPTHITPK